VTAEPDRFDFFRLHAQRSLCAFLKGDLIDRVGMPEVLLNVDISVLEKLPHPFERVGEPLLPMPFGESLGVSHPLSIYIPELRMLVTSRTATTQCPSGLPGPLLPGPL
jgi:hypothetical protein